MTTTSSPTPIPAQLAVLALTFGVGILVGQQFCSSAPPEPDEHPCPPAQTRVVEYCPPEPLPAEDPPEDSPPLKPPMPSERSSQGDPLPQSPPPVTPQQRRLLLGWARGQAPSLQGCPRDLGTTYRLVVSLTLDDNANIDDVAISSDDELTNQLESCLRDRILRWQIPSELHPTNERLVFRLTL